jgi:hypothetical protein
MLPKRNMITLFLLLPLAIFSWFIGWSLYWTGARKQQEYQPEHKQTELTFTVITPEQKYAT